MDYNINWAKEKFDQEDSLKFLFFWGNTPRKDGKISKSCLSQWWEESFEVDNISYKSAEHWMMAGKAKLFDPSMFDAIITCNSPAEAKKLGRKVKNFDSSIWNEEKYELVKQGNIHKFNQNEEMKDFLLNTKGRILVEASPYDRIWGIGLSQNDENINNPYLWKGKNLLGFALMEARDSLNIS